MSRRVAFRQCDVERALRAAKATGAGPVMIRPDGTIEVAAGPLDSGSNPARWKDRLADQKGVVL